MPYAITVITPPDNRSGWKAWLIFFLFILFSCLAVDGLWKDLHELLTTSWRHSDMFQTLLYAAVFTLGTRFLCWLATTRPLFKKLGL